MSVSFPTARNHIATVETFRNELEKPRIYWRYYPKLKRGFWAVSPIASGKLSDWQLRKFAYEMVEQMNRAHYLEIAERELRRAVER